LIVGKNRVGGKGTSKLGEEDNGKINLSEGIQKTGLMDVLPQREVAGY